jgi:hypothetical protein
MLKLFPTEVAQKSGLKKLVVFRLYFFLDFSLFPTRVAISPYLARFYYELSVFSFRAIWSILILL